MPRGRLLFFYLVLAIGVQMANQWGAALAAECKPVSATLPWWTTYGVPPSSITTVCSGSLPIADMLIYAALAIVFMIVCVAVPHMAAKIAGGTIGLALSHVFEAAFIAQTVIRPITSALQTGFSKAAPLGKMVWSRWRRSRSCRRLARVLQGRSGCMPACPTAPASTDRDRVGAASGTRADSANLSG